IHRDVDPTNLMLCADGRIKLMDFGVVKLSDGVRKSLTGLGAILGKPHYAAPEQIRNRPDDVVDESTDLYAAGITLYELLTGQVPFDAPNEYDLMQLQIQQPLPRHPRLSREAFSFLQKATTKDQRRRYRSAGQMRRALVGLPTGPVSPPLPPLWKRQPVQVAAVTLSVLLLLGGMYFQNRADKKARYLALCERAEGFRTRMKFDSAARVFGEALVVWETDSIRLRKKMVENLPKSIALFQRQRYSGATSSFAADTLDPSAREAFYYLGILRFYGLGTPADTQRAVALYRHAARLGYALAQVRLGNALVNGWGIRVDFAEAETWYQLARADSTGFARGDALYGLYYLYASGGNGLTRDYPRSLGFLRASARVGSLEAMHRLGVKYRYGDALLTQNPDSARYWLRLAAGAGHREATRQLQELGGTNPFNLNTLFNGTRRKPTPPRRRRSSFWENLFGPSRRTPSKR
ncbi:MAG: SEL1-like repeat protein, partial [Sphingobacteriaceae bacterium]|nr:SEL1-like repeat protein [Cytophagaceae bacterium]